MRLKDPKSLIYYAFQICMADPCDNESTKIFPTESKIIDVCDYHYKQLEAEKYIT